jgi:hypothetical protein
MAEESPFELFSGNDATLKVTVVDKDNNNLPVNLSGVLSILWKLALLPSSKTFKIEKSLSSGITVTDAANGKVEVVLTAAETEPLKGAYYHEMRVTTSGSKKVTVMYGEVLVSENLVRG